MKKIFLTFLLFAALPSLALALTITPRSMISSGWNSAINAWHNPFVILNDSGCSGIGETNCWFSAFNFNNGEQMNPPQPYAGNNSLKIDMPYFGYNNISVDTRIAFVQLETTISDCNELTYDECVATGAIVSSDFLDVSVPPPAIGGGNRVFGDNAVTPLVDTILNLYLPKADTPPSSEGDILMKIGEIGYKPEPDNKPKGAGEIIIVPEPAETSDGPFPVDGQVPAEQAAGVKNFIFRAFNLMGEYIGNEWSKIKKIISGIL